MIITTRPSSGEPENENMVVFKIKDEGGKGIPLDAYRSVRAGMIVKKNQGGLGLYLARIGIEKMEGQIIVDSLINSGTEVQIWLKKAI